MRRRPFMQAALAGAATALARPALAAAEPKFPSRPITFIVPFAAGGGGDTVARLMAQTLSDRLHSPVLVDNRVGAGGSIGASFVLRAPPDGYTLLSMSSTYPIQAAVTKVPFDPIADMQPVMMVSRDVVAIVMPADSPIRTTRDLIAAAKKQPGKLTYASAGVGSIAHLGMVELATLLGIELTHIPYKGTSQAMTDLMGKNVDMLLSSLTYIAPYIKNGSVHAIGVSRPQRARMVPDVPTFAEQGFPGYDVVDWKAMAGPKGMPADIVAMLNTELNACLKSKTVVDRFETDGTEALGGTPDEMLQTVKSDIERWKRVAQSANVKIE